MKSILFFLLTTFSLQAFARDRYEFPQGSVQILGSPQTIAVVFDLLPDWHIYWKNPGDSGAAPKWKWALSGGSVGDVLWPLPQRIEVQGLFNFGYEKQVVFEFPVTTKDPKVEPRPKRAELDLEFLVCKVECIPYQTKLQARWSTNKNVPLEQMLKKIPRAQGPLEIEGTWNSSDKSLEFQVPLSRLRDANQATFDLFPEDGDRYLATPPQIERTSESLRIRVAVNTNTEDLSGPSRFLLTASKENQPVAGWTLTLENPKAKDPATPVTELATAGATAGDGPQPFAVLLLWAFLGGVILNLMPCVFPVLGLKILSFWGPQKDSKRLLRHSWSYAVGVIFSFVALGGLLLFLRSLGEQIGWGFQLQSPLVVILLAMLFFWLGLNLLGFFEITWTPSLDGESKNEGLTSSFLTGVLATVVATPCTAPFMGAALGAALALPAGLTLLIFSFLGLGMAAPFLALGYFPQGLRHLPRPGNWMLRLKEFLAFPLFVTCVWLLWVLGQQVTIEVLCLVLLLMVLVGFLVWVHAVAKSIRLKRGSLILGVVLSVAVPFSFHTDQKAVGINSTGVWQEFSEEAVDRARAEGKPVFIDFTAAWCITCQVNKRLVLNTEEVVSEFNRHGVVLFRADWTDRDPKITAALAKLGRNSLPVYAYYAPRAERALLLPEVLTRETVFETLNGGK